MNDLILINEHQLEVKQRQGERIVTFEDIDRIHERVEGTASRNFRENRQRFIKDTDFFLVTGDELRVLKQTTNFVGSNAKEIILVSESGYLMLAKSLTDNLAWEVQRQLVNNYFRGKGLVDDLNGLSPQLQILIKMEMEQNRIKEELQETKEEVQAIRDAIVINPGAEWRKETNKILNSIGKKSDDYQRSKNEVYEALKERANCRPSVLINNIKKRALENGMAPSKVDKVNILDVLENDLRLREIYVTIVKEMAIKYGVSPK